MYRQAKKLRLIEELLKVDSDGILTEVENVLAKLNRQPRGKSFQSFTSALTIEEVNELERNIHEGCEQINENDWK